MVSCELLITNGGARSFTSQFIISNLPFTIRMSSLTTVNPFSVSNRLKIGRTALLLIYATALISVLISIPARYSELAAPYNGETYDLSRLTVRDLPEIGLSPTAYATIALANELLWVGVPLLIAGIIIWQRSDDLFPVFSGVMLVAFTATTIYLLDAMKPLFAPMFYIENVLQSFSLASLAFFFYLFPNGRFAPRALRYVALFWLGLNIAWIIFPEMPGNFLHESAAWKNPALAYGLGAFVFGSGVFAQIYRYRRISTPTERQQTKWIVFGMIVFYIGFTSRSYFFGRNDLDGVVQLGLTWVGSWMMLAFPISFGLALLRYRLWDIDLFLSRTFVYGSLVALLLGVYLSVVFGTQSLLNSPSPLSNFAATLLVAVLFQPLRDRLQKLASRYLFGDRDDPIRVLGQLGQRLEGVVDSAEILPTIVDSLTTSLRVPYAAIALREDGAYTIASEQGALHGTPLTLPLSYQGSQVGELRVAQRTTADPFDERDLKLLDTVAQQAGTAVHAVQLTRDLQRSRQRLVTTREEERRRLRRDLHDGLGPTLAAQIFRVGAVRQLVHKNPDKADALLADLEDGLDNTLNEIRRLVYALRPPALDQLGLIGATKDFTRKYDGQLAVTFEHPASIEPLSAAAEVAAFRIIQAALDNVAQHAQATNCTIRLATAAQQLQLDIRDNGVGIGQAYRAGVGLTAMRERAEELGGTFAVSTIVPSGTQLLATLPITGG